MLPSGLAYSALANFTAIIEPLSMHRSNSPPRNLVFRFPTNGRHRTPTRARTCRSMPTRITMRRFTKLSVESCLTRCSRPIPSAWCARLSNHFRRKRTRLPACSPPSGRHVATTIYQAWSGVSTPSSQFVEVYAMRVKTAPFGHNGKCRLVGQVGNLRRVGNPPGGPVSTPRGGRLTIGRRTPSPERRSPRSRSLWPPWFSPHRPLPQRQSRASSA
jgi:hypothetical protein